MANVLLLILLIISIILTGLILIQRSEGGALGIGGGGGGGGFMSGRSAANSVTRMTGILGAAFLVISLLLSIAFDRENQTISVIDDANAVEALTIDVDSGDETDPLASLGESDSRLDDVTADVTTDGNASESDTPVNTDDQPDNIDTPDDE